jgi:dTDP-4-dehydrorhamnose reductase
MTRVIVLGASGQLGRDLNGVLNGYANYEVFYKSRAELSIDDYENIKKYINDINPDFVINCAAYTKVDLAEKEISLAMKINAYAVGHLAKACQNIKCKLIHISSDYVYDNGSALPLNETSQTHPKSIYAISKLIGDHLALRNNPQTIILRTSWVYSTYGHNFVKTMIKLAAEKEALTIVEDQIGCPTYSGDLASTIVHIMDHITKAETFQAFGIYNYANEGITNWKEFAKEIFTLIGKDINLTGTTTKAYNAPAPRPLWSKMNLGKVKSTFGLDIPHWTTSLKKMINS